MSALGSITIVGMWEMNYVAGFSLRWWEFTMGIVLLALPPVLFVVMYRLNSEYCKVLFTDPMGQWMLWAAIVLQLVGALVIRKIINIKV